MHSHYLSRTQRWWETYLQTWHKTRPTVHSPGLAVKGRQNTWSHHPHDSAPRLECLLRFHQTGHHLGTDFVMRRPHGGSWLLGVSLALDLRSVRAWSKYSCKTEYLHLHWCHKEGHHLFWMKRMSPRICAVGTNSRTWSVPNVSPGQERRMNHEHYWECILTPFVSEGCILSFCDDSHSIRKAAHRKSSTQIKKNRIHSKLGHNLETLPDLYWDTLDHESFSLVYFFLANFCSVQLIDWAFLQSWTLMMTLIFNQKILLAPIY